MERQTTEQSPVSKRFQFKRNAARSPALGRGGGRESLTKQPTFRASRLRYQLNEHQNDRSIWNEALSKLLEEVPPSLGEVSNVLAIVQTKITYPNRAISKRDCGRMVSSLCDLLLPEPAKHEDLAIKLTQYIFMLSQKHCLELGVMQLEKVMQLLLALVRNCSTFFRSDTLRALGFILFDNGDRCSQFVDECVEILAADTMIGNSVVELEVKHLAFNCIANLVSKAGYPVLRPHVKFLFNKAFQSLASQVNLQSTHGVVSAGQLDVAKALSTTLRVLKSIISLTVSVPSGKSTNRRVTVPNTQQGKDSKGKTEDENIVEFVRRTVPAMLQALRGLFTYGLEFPSPFGEMAGNEGKQTSNRLQRVPWRSSKQAEMKEPVHLKLSRSSAMTSLARLSESEFSDGGGLTYASDVSTSMVGTHMSSKMRTTHVKLRCGVAEVLVVLVKLAPKEVLDQWPLIFPQKNAVEPSPTHRSLLSVLLHDPHPNSRNTAAVALAALVDQSNLREWFKRFNLAPRSKPTKGAIRSFIPASERLMNNVREIHSALAHSLEHESNPQVLCQVLCCVSSIFNQTPFDSGFVQQEITIAPILTSLLRHLCSGNLEVSTATQPAILAVLHVAETPLQEVREWIVGVSGMGYEGTLLGYIIANGKPSSKLPVRVIALNLIAQAFRFYGTAMAEKWNIVNPLLFSALRDSNEQIRLCAVKIIEEITRCRSKPTCDHLLMNLYGWGEIVLKYLPWSFCDTFHSVRTVAASSLSQLLLTDWQLIANSGIRHTFINSVLEGVKEGGSSIRASAARVLSSITSVAEFKTVEFVTLALPIYRSALQDDQLQVRSRIATSLADLTFTPSPAVVRRSGGGISCRITKSNASDDSRGEEINSLDENSWSLQQKVEMINSDVPEVCGPALLSFMSLEDIFSLTRLCLSHVDDHDKVSSACIRALGYLLRWLTVSLSGFEECHDENLNEVISLLPLNLNATDTTSLVIEVIQSLSRKTREGNAKANWNACHAIAHVVRGNCVPISGPFALFGPKGWVKLLPESKASSLGSVRLSPSHRDTRASARCIKFSTSLLDALESSDNYKVKISACSALLSATLARNRICQGCHSLQVLSRFIQVSTSGYYSMVDRESVRKPQERIHFDDLKASLIRLFASSAAALSAVELQDLCNKGSNILPHDVSGTDDLADANPLLATLQDMEAFTTKLQPTNPDMTFTLLPQILGTLQDIIR